MEIERMLSVLYDKTCQINKDFNRVDELLTIAEEAGKLDEAVRLFEELKQLHEEYKRIATTISVIHEYFMKGS